MAFPAAPTESGAAKIHFGTTDGNAAAGWFAVDTGATGTGANTVGFLAIATHVEDDPVGTPGGLSTTSVPLVLIGAARDDALSALSPAEGDAVRLRVDANGALWTHDDALDAALAGSELQVDIVASLPAGTNAIGKLGANSGVDIGDVDVTSIIPGTGATSLGKAIDTSAGGTDTGVAALAIRDDALSALTPVEGDYVPLRVNSTGALHVTGGGGGTEFAVDDALGGTPTGTLSLARRDDALSALSPVEGDAIELRVDANGALWTHDDALDAALAGSELQVDIVASLPAGTNNIGDVDVLSLIPGTGATDLGKAIDSSGGGTDTGVAVLVIRDDALTTLTPVDGDYVALRVNSTGALHVTGGGGGTQFNVDDALGGTPTGTLSLARRDDTLSALSPVEGDAIELRVDANGALWTHDDALDAALAGSELQVDIIASLPAGTNNIGDVDILSLVPGTGATALGKAIDSSGGGTDTGVAALAIRDDALTTLTPVDGDYVALRVNSTGALHVTGGGGGTEFAVDDALGATPTGTLSLARRDDTLSALSPVEGDAIELRVDANGALWTHDDVLDAALSGSELQVDIVAPLPAGTNAIGTLAANSGVDIGDVDVTSIIPGTGATSLGKAEDAAHGGGDTGVMMLAVRQDTAAALALTDGDYIPLTTDADGRLYVTIVDGGGSITIDGTITASDTAGNVAHDGADSGNPVKVGGRAQDQDAQPDEVADNDRVDALFDRNGYQRVRGDMNPSFADINDAISGNNTIIAAAGVGKKIAVWAILIVSDGTTDVRWEDGAAGTAFTGQIPLQVREGYSISAGGLVPLFIGSANTLLNLELTAAVNVHGFVSFTVVDD